LSRIFENSQKKNGLKGMLRKNVEFRNEEKFAQEILPSA